MRVYACVRVSGQQCACRGAARGGGHAKRGGWGARGRGGIERIGAPLSFRDRCDPLPALSTARPDHRGHRHVLLSNLTSSAACSGDAGGGQERRTRPALDAGPTAASAPDTQARASRAAADTASREAGRVMMWSDIRGEARC
jgi:hypothetical protein